MRWTHSGGCQVTPGQGFPKNLAALVHTHSHVGVRAWEGWPAGCMYTCSLFYRGGGGGLEERELPRGGGHWDPIPALPTCSVFPGIGRPRHRQLQQRGRSHHGSVAQEPALAPKDLGSPRVCFWLSSPRPSLFPAAEVGSGSPRWAAPSLVGLTGPPVCRDRSPIHGGHWVRASGE